MFVFVVFVFVVVFVNLEESGVWTGVFVVAVVFMFVCFWLFFFLIGVNSFPSLFESSWLPTGECSEIDSRACCFGVEIGIDFEAIFFLKKKK